MPLFEMIQYHGRNYPPEFPIPLATEEVAGHFDVDVIRRRHPHMRYSLHTEFSYGERDFKSRHLQGCTAIQSAHRPSRYHKKIGVPQLWLDEQWAKEFAHFVLSLTETAGPPKYIEIHPPFEDYTPSLEEFLARYQYFEDIVLTRYPEVSILIENRGGTECPDSQFVLSSLTQLRAFVELLEARHSALQITLDIPQLFTAERLSTRTYSRIPEIIGALQPALGVIGGLHIWGSKSTEGARKRASHCGTLDDYFRGMQEVKQLFLDSLQIFQDGRTRCLVLEVNSNDTDLASIIEDLDSAGFTYV